MSPFPRGPAEPLGDVIERDALRAELGVEIGRSVQRLAIATILRSAAASGWFEQLGDLGNRFGAGLDVAHDGAWIAVPSLGHDELQGDALVAEVGGRGVAELVEVPGAVPARVSGLGLGWR